MTCHFVKCIMTYTDCFTNNEIKYCRADGYLVVGTGVFDSYNPNAVSSTYSGEIRIPSSINDESVKEISACAFSRCCLITSVYIEPGITKICKRAFADCYSLIKINIPSTIESIGTSGIHFFNFTTSNRVSSGTCIVHFEKNYVLKEIGSNCFGYKENVILYFENPVHPKLGTTCLNNVNRLKIISPGPFVFAGYKSFPKQPTQRPYCISAFTNILMISIILIPHCY